VFVSAEGDGRTEIGGSQGAIEWESFLQGEGLDGWDVNDDPWTPGAWSREGDTIIAESGDGNRARIVIGDDSWRAYELQVQMTMIKGGSAQLWFNIHDGGDYHFAPLMGWQTAAIMAPDHTKLDVVNHVFEWDQELRRRPRRPRQFGDELHRRKARQPGDAARVTHRRHRTGSLGAPHGRAIP